MQPVLKTVTLTVTHDAEGAAILRGVAAIIVADLQQAASASSQAPKAVKKAKAVEAPSAEDEELDFGEDAGSESEGELDFGSEEEETEAEDEPEAEEQPAKRGRGRPPKEEKTAPVAAGKKLTVEGDILPAFQRYAKKHSADKAKAVLTKLGVKSARDIKPVDYPKVLKLLAV